MTEQTTFNHDDHEYPLTMDAGGKTMHLRLLDLQTGDHCNPLKADKYHHQKSIKWLEAVYMDWED